MEACTIYMYARVPKLDGTEKWYRMQVNVSGICFADNGTIFSSVMPARARNQRSSASSSAATSLSRCVVLFQPRHSWFFNSFLQWISFAHCSHTPYSIRYTPSWRSYQCRDALVRTCDDMRHSNLLKEWCNGTYIVICYHYY